jgi:AcrR family transcriptional regulator
MGVTERRLKEREERIRSILEAALHVFAREGLRPATMDAIATEAQLGKGTIYYYFPSKEALLEELVAGLAGEYFRGLLEGAAGRATPVAIAQGIIEQLIAHYKRKPELFHVIHMVLGEPEPRPRKALAAFVDAHLHWLQDLEMSVSEALEAHGVPEEPFIYLVGTYSHGLLFEAVAGRDPDRLLAEATAAFQAFLGSASGVTSTGPNPTETRSQKQNRKEG